MLPSTREQIEQRLVKKGDVLLVAELAASMGAKKTSDLIPLCHPIPLTSVQVAHHFLDTQGDRAVLEFEVTVSAHYRTGIEMEALTACSMAALTVYDMCKAIDRGMVIRDLQVVHKSGGKSGTFHAPMASTD
jgi:cyclic pyranopterin phosphate synthase